MKALIDGQPIEVSENQNLSPLESLDSLMTRANKIRYRPKYSAPSFEWLSPLIHGMQKETFFPSEKDPNVGTYRLVDPPVLTLEIWNSWSPVQRRMVQDHYADRLYSASDNDVRRLRPRPEFLPPAFP